MHKSGTRTSSDADAGLGAGGRLEGQEGSGARFTWLSCGGELGGSSTCVPVSTCVSTSMRVPSIHYLECL